MPTAELVADRIALSDTSYRDHDLLKTLPGGKLDPELKQWVFAPTWTAANALRGLYGSQLTLGPELQRWGFEQLTSWVTRARELTSTLSLDGDDALYGFQRVGVEWMLTVRHGLLTDEMGTGKTVQVCSYLDRLPALDGPVLIVAPNTVKRVWVDHIKEWAPDLVAVATGKSAAQRRKAIKMVADGKANVLIINWEALRLHSRLAPYGSMSLKACTECGGLDPKVKPSACELHLKELNEIPWSVVIADEVHRAKDPKSKQTRALWAVAHKPSVESRLGLTGTPIANAPDDLWALLHFMMPEEWSSRVDYINRYCEQGVDFENEGRLVIKGLHPATEAELRQTLDVRMLRRSKKLVLPMLPAKTYERRYVTLGTKERSTYDEMENDLITYLDSGEELIGWNPLSQMARLIQLASASVEFVPDTGNLSPAPGELFQFPQVRLIEPSAKLDALVEVLTDLGDKPVVIAGMSRQLIQLAEKRLANLGISYGSIHGEISEADRAANIEAFQAGQLRCMLMTVAAGGVGITLHKADTIIFVQRSWSLVENLQAEDRIHRIGQEADNVLVIDLITENTIEEEVHSTIFEKQERLEEVVQDRKRLIAMLGGVK